MFPLRNYRVMLIATLTPLGCGHRSSSNAKPHDPPKQVQHQHADSGLKSVSSSGDLKVEEFGENEGFSGAGTAFQFESAPADSTSCIFGYGSEDDPADIKVNGKVYTLTCRQSKTVTPGRGKYELGKEEEWIWANDIVVAIFRFKTVAVGKDEFAYKGTLTLSMGGKNSVFKIKGGMGD